MFQLLLVPYNPVAEQRIQTLYHSPLTVLFKEFQASYGEQHCFITGSPHSVAHMDSLTRAHADFLTAYQERCI